MTKIPEVLNPVGYIGLGIMGTPMAQNLLRAGVDLRVWSRRTESAEALLDQGAQWCGSIGELTHAVRVLFLNVSDTSDVEDLLLGPTGILKHAEPGLILIDHSTIDPVRTVELAKRCHEKAVHFIDCPVSGGQRGAIHGTLTLMLGGEEEVIARVRPLLECVGETLTHVGACGAGQVAKACNQLIVGEALLAVGAAFALAESAGVDPRRVRDALLGGFAASRVLEVHAERLLENAFEPGFLTRLHKKDMDIVAATASALGLELPGVQRVQEALEAAMQHGEGEKDSSILARYAAQKNLSTR